MTEKNKAVTFDVKVTALCYMIFIFRGAFPLP